MDTYSKIPKLYVTENITTAIWDGSQIHPEVNSRYASLKIHDCIKQSQNEWKWSELSANSMGKGLHKFFKAVVNELNNAFPTLVESRSEVLYFIPEPRNFSEVTRLVAHAMIIFLNQL